MDVFAQLKEAIKEAERLAQLESQRQQGPTDWSQAPAVAQGVSALGAPPSPPPAPAGFSQLGTTHAAPAPASFSQVGAPPPAPRRQQGRRTQAPQAPQAPQPGPVAREFQSVEQCRMEDHFSETKTEAGPQGGGLLRNLRGDRLREAILLREVLGPPPGLLDD